MKIIHVNNPIFEVQDLIRKHSFDVETVRNVFQTVSVKSTEVTEYDDGLDEWLLRVKRQGHNEIYLHSIENCPIVYDPLNYEPRRYKLITYYSRYHEEIR